MRERLPGDFRRFLVIAVEVLHQLRDLFAYRAGGVALGQHVHQPHSIPRRLVLQYLAYRFRPQSLVNDVVNDFPTGRQAQLKAEGAGNLNEETVQCAYAQPVHLADDLAEHVAAEGRIERRQADVLGQFSKLIGTEGCLCESQEYAVEDFTGSLSGKRACQNRVQRCPA